MIYLLIGDSNIGKTYLLNNLINPNITFYDEPTVLMTKEETIKWFKELESKVTTSQIDVIVSTHQRFIINYIKCYKLIHLKV